MRHSTTRKSQWAAALAVATMWVGGAAPAHAGTISNFTIRSAFDPTRPGGVFGDGVPYGGTFTVDQDRYNANRNEAIFPDDIFTVDFHLSGISVLDLTGRTIPVAVNLPDLEFTNLPVTVQIFHLVAPDPRDRRFSGVDELIMTVTDIFDVPPTATTGRYRAFVTFELTFLEPIHIVNTRFVGGVIDSASYAVSLQDDTGTDAETITCCGSDFNFSAVALDPQAVPLAPPPAPEPGTATAMLLGLGLCVAGGRRRRWWVTSLAAAALWVGGAAPARAGTVQTFSIQNASDPTSPGGVFANGAQYGGRFTVDQDAYLAAWNVGAFPLDGIFASDLFLGPTSFTDISNGFGNPVQVNVPAHSFLNVLGDLNVIHLLPQNGIVDGLDLVTLTVRDFTELPATATTPEYFVRTVFSLSFFEPVRAGSIRFLGGVVVSSVYQHEAFGPDFVPVRTTNDSNSDRNFSAIAIDPQVIPAAPALSTPEPSSAVGLLLACGLFAVRRRRAPTGG